MSFEEIVRNKYLPQNLYWLNKHYLYKTKLKKKRYSPAFYCIFLVFPVFYYNGTRSYILDGANLPLFNKSILSIEVSICIVSI